MIGSVTSTAGTCTIHSRSTTTVQRPAAGRPMAKKPTARRSDWITATQTTPTATPRIVAPVSVTRWPPRSAAGKTSQQAPSEIGGASAVGDDDGGYPERKNERDLAGGKATGGRHEPCRWFAQRPAVFGNRRRHVGGNQRPGLRQFPAHQRELGKPWRRRWDGQALIVQAHD